jgi:hypothetical protein
MRNPLVTPAVSLLLVAAIGCGDGRHGPTASEYNPYGITTTGPGVLSVSPLDTSTVWAASPLGKLGPPGHVLPTDHVYINFVDAWSGNQLANDCSKRPVYAAGAGYVDFILVTEAAGDTKVDVWMTKTFHYYYDHVLLLPGITLGTKVAAGQQIATTTGRCPSIDLGAYDLDVTLPGLVKPDRYGDATRHAVSPYKYMTPALRDFYYRKSRVIDGVPYDRDGRIDFGVSGKLIGDWFHSSLPVDLSSTGTNNGWTKSIAFVPDWYDAKPRISIGGTIGPAFHFAIGKTDPDPVTVSTSNGLIVYELTLPGAFERYGWLLVQMTAADRIKVEYIGTPNSKPLTFTGAAQEYIR